MGPIAPFEAGTALRAGARVTEANRFVATRQIRFGHCDPAGLVFYPQYMLLLHEVFEDWFQYALGVHYQHMVSAAGIGVPLVSLDVKFARPSRSGDTVDFMLFVEAVGNSSTQIVTECRGEDGVRFTARTTFVTVDFQAARPIPIPAVLREAIEHFRTVGAREKM